MNKKYILILSTLLLASSCQENFDSHLQREANDYTRKHCPMRIEEGNTLDSMTYDIPTRTLTRWHSLSGIMDTPSSKSAFDKHPDLVRSQLLKELRGDVEKGTCKDEGILFRYVYSSSSNHEVVFTTTFTVSDYER